ncbi:18518_t:CDS:2 [Gigaspora margarita]|uniref:18518_t:CDS:1 n=1 Tax=Gigaspora margarita TaxID=4874 RepID=A0ABN7USE8_GIGMA|nr:18518_t:CDS:2 [Gigaspora margarita]
MDNFLSLPHFNTSEDDNYMQNALPSFDTNYYDQEHTSFMNALSSPYPNDYDLAGSSWNMYNFDPLGSFLQLNNDVLIESDITDDLYQQEIAREEDYDQSQSLFSSLLDNIPQNCVQEASLPTYQLQNRLESAQPTSLSFQYLMRFKQTPNIVQLKGPKQKYEFANNIDEFVNEIERFIENTKKNIHNQDENINPTDIGRQPKRYKSGGELPKKKVAKIESSNVESKKRKRHCQKYKGTAQTYNASDLQKILPKVLPIGSDLKGDSDKVLQQVLRVKTLKMLCKGEGLLEIGAKKELSRDVQEGRVDIDSDFAVRERNFNRSETSDDSTGIQGFSTPDLRYVMLKRVLGKTVQTTMEKVIGDFRKCVQLVQSIDEYKYWPKEKMNKSRDQFEYDE